IDNRSPGFSTTGTWYAPPTGYLGDYALSGNPPDGSKSASWSFAVEPGTYRVSLTWPSLVADATNAPFQVYDGTTPVLTKSVNQDGSGLGPNDFFENGVWWETLGLVTVSSTLRVHLTDLANAPVIADAVRVEKIDKPVTSAVADNLSSNFSRSGTWGLTTDVAYDASYYTSSSTYYNVDTADWSFAVDPGTYRIAVTWPSVSINPGASILTQVLDGSANIGTVYLNQQLAPNDYFANNVWWESIGYFTTSSTLTVRLSDSVANAPAIADAVRIEKVSNAIIVDNQSPAFSKTGNWDLASGPGYLASVYVATPIHDANESATWSFSVEPGAYRIASTWHAGNPAYGSKIPIQVLDGTSVVMSSSLDQRLSPDDFIDNSVWWESIGTANVTGSLLQVRIPNMTTDLTQGYAIADAMRIERIVSGNPIAQDDAYFVASNTDLTVLSSSTPPLRLRANDTGFDSNPLQAKIASFPSNGTLLSFGTDGAFKYRPKKDFVGIDSFTYTTHNGKLESAPAQVVISVGTRLLGRRNLDSNVFNDWSSDLWLSTNLLDPMNMSEGFGMGYSNIPPASSQDTEGGMAATGGLQLVEDVAPGVAMVYRSNSISKPIIAIDTALAPGQAIPSDITASLTFNGVSGQSYSYSTVGLQPGQPMRFAIQVDGWALPTGMYDYTMNVTTTTAGVPSTQSFSGKQAIINRANSEFGNGWGLDGLDRLFDGPTGALMVRGNGDYLWFPKSGNLYLHAAGDWSYSNLVKNTNGTFKLTSKTGIQSNFSTLGLLTTRTDTNNNIWTYTYSDKNADSVAAELASITDPFGRVTNFNYTGGVMANISHFSG
ncbi:MAG: Ig-like domain-containing protein, partial [Pirellula sp.]